MHSIHQSPILYLYEDVFINSIQVASPYVLMKIFNMTSTIINLMPFLMSFPIDLKNLVQSICYGAIFE